MTCNAAAHIFTCGYADNCADEDLTFELPVEASNQFILKPVQAQLLQFGTEAVTLQPTPTNIAREGGVSVVTVTSTASGKAAGASSAPQTGTEDVDSGSAGYTAGQMAGVGAGVGVPLLLALLAALFVIFRQKKRLGENATGQQQPMEQTYAYRHAAAHDNAGYYAQGNDYNMSEPPRPEIATKNTPELDSRRLNELSAK